MGKTALSPCGALSRKVGRGMTGFEKFLEEAYGLSGTKTREIVRQK